MERGRESARECEREGCGVQSLEQQVAQVVDTQMRSGSEAGSYLRLIDFVHH